VTDEAREILKQLDSLSVEEVARLAISVLLTLDDAELLRAATGLNDAMRAKLTVAFLPPETQQRLADALRAAQGTASPEAH
jgi:hypothetical protein